MINTPVRFPFLPIVTVFPDHPATKGLEQVILQFASPVEFKGGPEKGKFTPLMLTSKKAGLVQPPTYFDVGNKKWTDNDFRLEDIVLGGVLENTEIMVGLGVDIDKTGACILPRRVNDDISALRGQGTNSRDESVADEDIGVLRCIAVVAKQTHPLDQDGHTPLSIPHCTEIRRDICLNGRCGPQEPSLLYEA